MKYFKDKSWWLYLILCGWFGGMNQFDYKDWRFYASVLVFAIGMIVYESWISSKVRKETIERLDKNKEVK